MLDRPVAVESHLLSVGLSRYATVEAKQSNVDSDFTNRNSISRPVASSTYTNSVLAVERRALLLEP
jgi:hypothetical protein